MTEHRRASVTTKCAHVGTVEMNNSTPRAVRRICADCGATAVANRVKEDDPIVIASVLFVRPEELVKKVSPEEYLKIEKSFDVRTPEYRDRLFQMLDEAIATKAVSLRELQQVIKDNAYKP